MIKWGIIGLGNMGNNFAEATKEINDVTLNAIASQNDSKLQSFKKKFNIPNESCFANYDQLIESNLVDAIYIATLNNTHLNLIKKCSKFNKHILCEKPATINKTELYEIEKIIKAADISFLEAIAFRSHPLVNEFVKILSENKYENIISIEANFGFDTKKINPTSRLYNKDFGGGAILDVGCYPLAIINLVNNLIDKNNDIIFSKVDGNICETGVDDYAFAELKIAEKIKCNITVAIKKQLINNVTIKTKNGKILLKEPWLPSKKTYIEVEKNGHYYKKHINCEHSVYANQINFFNNMIKKKIKTPNFPNLSFDDTLNIAKISLEWREKLYSKNI
tara:strand:- start:311 stop:1315 length:1005 start_codon:yes stop_codon:yes gene_type:complete